MAGKSQHYIPRLWIRGFLCEKCKRVEKVWVYRKGCDAAKQGIDKVFTQNKFYGEPGQDLDDEITRAENRYGEIVRQLREQEKPALDPRACAELCAHMAVRTRYIRATAEAFGNALIETTTDTLQEDADWKNLILREPERSKKRIVDSILEKPDTASLPRNERRKLRSYLEAMSLKQLLAYLPDGFSAAIKQALSRAKEGLGDVARMSQIRTLTQGLAPEPRVQRLQTYEWGLVDRKDGPELILGDCGPLARVNRNICQTLAWSEKEVAQVMIPVASNRLLVGTYNKDMDLPQFEEVNCAQARLSRELFVAQSTSAERYHSMLGSDPFPATQERLEKLRAKLGGNTESLPGCRTQ